jgi:hypothetical protein
VLFKKYVVGLHIDVPFGAAPPPCSLNTSMGLEKSCFAFLQALVSKVKVNSMLSTLCLKQKYRTGPIMSRDLVPSHIINYSQKSGNFSRNDIFGAILILIIHGIWITLPRSSD